MSTRIVIISKQAMELLYVGGPEFGNGNITSLPEDDVPARPVAFVPVLSSAAVAPLPRHHHGCLSNAAFSPPKYVCGPRPKRLLAYANRLKYFRLSSGPIVSRKFLRSTRYTIESPTAAPVTLPASHLLLLLFVRRESDGADDDDGVSAPVHLRNNNIWPPRIILSILYTKYNVIIRSTENVR